MSAAIDAADLLAKLQALIAQAAPAAPARASYSVDEVAAELGKARFTVREWCRLGQCHAYKLPGWRSGPHDRWRIAAGEVERLRQPGSLLALDRTRNAGKVGDR